MENNLKQKIMFRIYIEFFKNTLIERYLYIVFTTFGISFFMFVSVKDVLNNMPKDSFVSTFNFIFVAVRDTEAFMQALLAIVGIILISKTTKFIYKNVQNLKVGSVFAKV